MTIILDIRPEIEAELARQAAVQGLGIDVYVTSLLEEATQASSVKPTSLAAAKDMVELFAPVRGLFAEGELDFSRNPSTSRPIDLS